MSKYYSGYLPQGASIVTELEKEHTYAIEPSATLCFPFKMRRYYNQVVIDLADMNPFESCFIPALRCWPSIEAAGTSITAQPLASRGDIVLGPNGTKWNFWLLDLIDISSLEPADINRWIEPDKIYWMNVQNLHNRPGTFWLRYTFYGTDISHVE